MFTGLVQTIGTVTQIDKTGDWRVRISCDFDLPTVPMGASIMHSGVCLTVTNKGADWYDVEVSHETLDKTTLKYWAAGTKINLERSLCMGDELGGHFVFGHVDTCAELVLCEQDEDSRRLRLNVPAAYMKFLAAKGSVALDGISLTVNDVDDETCTFGVNIIPHSWTHTTLHTRKIGDTLNFEVDMLARYVQRMIKSGT
jgi:riboflavin synthase